MATNYPPYQHPLLDRQTGLVSKIWHQFFLTLGGGTLVQQIPVGGVTLDQLQVIDSPRLLGRGSAGVGVIEQILIGDGLTMTDTTLSVTADGLESLGYWTPVTNGDPLSPEILFDAEGDCVVGFVPTPGTA